MVVWSSQHLQDEVVEQLRELRVLLHHDCLEVGPLLKDVQGLKIVLQPVIWV